MVHTPDYGVHHSLGTHGVAAEPRGKATPLLCLGFCDASRVIASLQHCCGHEGHQLSFCLLRHGKTAYPLCDACGVLPLLQHLCGHVGTRPLNGVPPSDASSLAVTVQGLSRYDGVFAHQVPANPLALLSACAKALAFSFCRGTAKSFRVDVRSEQGT